MSKFTRKVSDIAFSTFTSLFTDFQKPANWGKNYLPISDRDRVARYELLDAIVNNYLGELLRSKSLISVKYDEKGRFIEPYEGYGEAKKIATLISNAILGDDIRLDTDNEELQKLWYDLKMKLVLQDGEDRGAEIGDMVYHIVTNEEGTPFIDWVDPEGFFIFKREFDKILHCAIAYFPIEGTKEEQKLLLVTEYKIFQNVVYWKKARYEVMKDNDEQIKFAHLSERENLTENPMASGGDDVIDLAGFAKLGFQTGAIDEIPIVHIPFMSKSGELWGQSSFHYVANALTNVYGMNSDLNQSARLAAIPIFWKRRDAYNTDGVKFLNPDTNELEAPTMEPGTLIDGETGLVDNSDALKAALEYRRELMRFAHENNNIPSVITDPDRSKIISGVALDITLYPFRTFIEKIRGKRIVQYDDFFRILLKRIGKWNETSLEKTTIVFGAFANLGNSLLEIISKVVLSGILTNEEGRQVLIDSGIIDPEIINQTLPSDVGVNQKNMMGVNDNGNGSNNVGNNIGNQNNGKQRFGVTNQRA